MTKADADRLLALWMPFDGRHVLVDFVVTRPEHAADARTLVAAVNGTCPWLGHALHEAAAAGVLRDDVRAFLAGRLSLDELRRRVGP